MYANMSGHPYLPSNIVFIGIFRRYERHIDFFFLDYILKQKMSDHTNNGPSPLRSLTEYARRMQYACAYGTLMQDARDARRWVRHVMGDAERLDRGQGRGQGQGHMDRRVRRSAGLDEKYLRKLKVRGL